MIFGYILLLIALLISSVAAYYSIAGLTAIFAAAFWPIVIMGGVLEIGKIATTVWLHKYWDRAALQFKLYLVPAIAILMLITSMGIFGFLSKAHLDQAIPSGDISSQVSIFDDKIRTERDNIEAAKKALKQMDSQVDERLSRSSDDKGAERAVQIRKSQAKERASLQNDIQQSQKKISQLQTERAPIASQQRKVEAEVGPIKYIAALIYGDNPDANVLERAVRWVIILLVLVFDPLALVLILAADQTFAWHREDKKKQEGWEQVWQPKTENPWADIEPLTTKQLDKIKDVAGNIKTKMKGLFDKKEPGPVVEEPKIEEPAEEPAEIKKPSLEDGLNGIAAEDYINFITANTVAVENSEPVATVPVENITPLPTAIHHDPEPIKIHKQIQLSGVHDPEPIVYHKAVDIPSFAITEEDTNPVNAGFGTEFPINPLKGDMFLRVDYLPSRLYKWNEKKWIEVDKTKTDSFAYDEAYIQHLIDKIASGEYDMDMVSAAEQEQISRYLQNGKPN
jgi:hypothetical protein